MKSWTLTCSGSARSPLLQPFGQPYLWHGENPRPMPPHLVELLRAVPTIPRPMVRRGDGKGLVAFVAGQSDGNRSKALFWAACRAAEDGALDEIGEALVATATLLGIGERSARTQLDSAREQVRRLSANFDLAAIADSADVYPRTWQPVDLTEVLNGTWEAPQPTVGRRSDGVGLFYPTVWAISARATAGLCMGRGRSCRVHIGYTRESVGAIYPQPLPMA